MPNPDPSYVKAGEPVSASWANNLVGAVRRLDNTTKRQPLKLGGGGGGSSSCPFGEVIPIDDETYSVGIRGGVVICGDKNFNVAPYGFYTDTDMEALISLKLASIQFNVDDDDQFIMPGIKTSTGTPAYENTPWTDTANYPDNTNPDSPTSLGTIFVPLGKLTVKDSAYTFEAVGCGNITINHCGSILASTRF